MKKLILASTLLAVVLSFGLRAMSGNSEKDEVLVRSLSNQEIAEAKATFKQFSEITSMDIVSIEGEKFMKVEGLGLKNDVMSILMSSNANCGECFYEDRNNAVPGIWYYYAPSGGTPFKYCGTCEEISNPF